MHVNKWESLYWKWMVHGLCQFLMIFYSLIGHCVCVCARACFALLWLIDWLSRISASRGSFSCRFLGPCSTVFIYVLLVSFIFGIFCFLSRVFCRRRASPTEDR